MTQTAKHNGIDMTRVELQTRLHAINTELQAISAQMTECIAQHDYDTVSELNKTSAKLSNEFNTISSKIKRLALKKESIGSRGGSAKAELTTVQIAALDTICNDIIQTELIKSAFGEISIDSFKQYLARYVRGAKLTVRVDSNEISVVLNDILDALDNGYTVSEVKNGQARNNDGELIVGDLVKKICTNPKYSSSVFTRKLEFRNPYNGEVFLLSNRGRKPDWITSVFGEDRMALCINREQALDDAMQIASESNSANDFDDFDDSTF